MREILFRGKTVREKWVYGLLANIGSAWYISNKAGVSTAYEVIPSTVGQYTGLTDKNGTKIFEGDILHRAYHPEEDYIIEWNDACYRFRRRKASKERGYESLCCTQGTVARLKVIGNIHDNPDLLKGEVE